MNCAAWYKANGVVLNLVLGSLLPDAGRWQVGTQSRKADAPSQTQGAELSGRISRLLSATRFELAGVVVDSSAASVQGLLAVGSRVEVTGDLVFSKGQRSDLAVGRRLRVLAQPSADRTLLEATEIRFDN